MFYQSTFIYQTTSINQFFINQLFINLFYQLTFHHCFIQHFINFPYIINLLTMLLPELFTKLYCTLYLLSSFVVYFNYVILQSSNYLFIYDFFLQCTLIGRYLMMPYVCCHTYLIKNR